MANEFQHKDPGATLTQAEYITTDGTGHIFDSQAQGDILYASSSTVLSRLAKSGTTTHALLNTGSSNNPAWALIPLASAVTGTLPVANGGTGITSLGSNVATFLGTPSSANLRAALTDETGTGAAVFATSPTLVTPALGTPASGVMTNVSGTASSLTAGNVTTNANLTGVVTSSGNATAIADKAIGIAKLADGTDGELITWNASGVIAAVAAGNADQVLTSNGAGAAPTFQAAGGTTLSGSTNNTVATVTGANALIGEANLTFTGSHLTVAGTMNIENAADGIVMRFKDTDSTGTAVNQYFTFTGSDDATVGYIGKTSTGQMYFFNESSTNTIIGAGGLTRLTIASNGTFTGSASNDISDSRIKENIEDTPVGLAEIMQLRPVKYNFQAGKGWGEPDQKFYGLLAQEVEAVIPEAVHTELIDIDEVVAGKKHDVNGVSDLKSVSMSQITAALIKAVQELKAEIEALKA